MKKVFALFLVCCLLLSGCEATPTHMVQTLSSKDGKWIEKQISNPTTAVESKKLHEYFLAFFNIAPEDLLAEVNKRASEKGYPAVVYSTELRSLNRYIYPDKHPCFDLIPSDGGIQQIRLSLYSADEAEKARIGDYIYFFIDIFNPGMQVLIADELGVFEEHAARQISVTCGNVVYRAQDEALFIDSVDIPYVAPPNSAAAIRPQP